MIVVILMAARDPIGCASRPPECHFYVLLGKLRAHCSSVIVDPQQGGELIWISKMFMVDPRPPGALYGPQAPLRSRVLLTSPGGAENVDCYIIW